MKIKLETLTLENFKGIKKQIITFFDNTEIFGKNEACKTTLMDGFLWLFTGKDSSGKADFEIKTTDSAGIAFNNLEHSVEAVISADGKAKVFKKVYRENWTKKRGEANKELTGHITDHFVDGVPIPKKDYILKVSELINEKLFSLLTDTRFFNEQMHWTDRRLILTEICGKIEESEIEGYDLIKSFLKERSIDDQKKIVTLQKKKINEQLKSIPHKIQENHRMITEDQPPKERLQQEKLRQEQDELRQKITGLKTDSGTQERKKKIADIETEITTKQNDFEKNQRMKRGPIQENIDVIRTDLKNLDNSIEELSGKILAQENEVKSKEIEVQSIRDEWTHFEQESFSIDEKCPTCSQNIPDDQIQTARENFNLNKSESLSDLSETGKKLNSIIENLKTENIIFAKELKEENEKRTGFKKSFEVLQTELESIESVSVDVSDLETKKDGIKKALDNQTPVDVSEFESKITAIDDEIEEERKLLLKIDNNESLKTRIKELEEEEKTLSQEFADLEKQLFNIEKFIVSKVELIEAKINGLFKIARFKMFETQINGGINEICEVMKNGVIYNSMNNAGQTQVGVDIINTLQEHYKSSGPIWIDNRESITDIPETDCQTISLYVSPEDKKLRVESA